MRKRPMSMLGGAGIVAIGSLAGAAVFRNPASASSGGPGASARAVGSGTPVIDWNKELVKLLETPGLQPAGVHPTRSLAILQAAELDAVASTTGGVTPFLFSVPAPRDARADAAVDQAAHDALVALFPVARPQLDQTLQDELAGVPDSAGKTDGEKVGGSVAAILSDVRAFDGSAAPAPTVAPGTGPGQYRPTPDKFPAPVFTGWGKVAPFVLGSPSQFQPAPPPAVGSAAYAQALLQVESLGQDTSTTRTPDQTVAGTFWGSSPIWITWNQITQNLVADHHTSLVRAARTFADLDLSLADSAIALYDAKYGFYVWRPITAIRAGSTGYNPAITGNPTWEALAQTAADPSYPGAHSTFSESAATVLDHFFPDEQDLVVTSDKMPGTTRTFSSIRAAANEAALSRIWAGQHTSFDDTAGRTLGAQVAQFELNQLDSAP